MEPFDFRLLSFIGIKKTPKAPWSKYYKKSSMKIFLKNESIYDYALRKMNKHKFENNVAINYFGKRTRYRDFFKKIDSYSKKFLSMGIRKYDVVTIVSANIPEALISFYALNKIGAVVNIIHPLLSKNEIKEALIMYKSSYLITMDITLDKVVDIIESTEVEKVIVISPSDSMNIFLKAIYKIKTRKTRYKEKLSSKFMYLKDFLNIKEYEDYYTSFATKDDPALILQSGGSTGTPKGIVLSNGNVNASTVAALNAYPDLCKDDKILGIMPIFHGFGLEVSMNDAFSVGAEVVLIPTFKAQEFHKLLIKHKPTVIVGVPTLFEALTTNKYMEGVSLKQLKYVISGGDTLSKDRVENINKFLHEHESITNMIQGYGLTEAVAAASCDLRNNSRPGTIGIPWPGIYMGIFVPNTDTEVGYNEDGEICICGPTIMLGYYNNDKETMNALMHHRDGNIWLHTGDIGSMDKDGFITYRQRIKRMIVTSGYNVYPSQIEEVIKKHEAVENVSVVGIPHQYKVEVAKAYIVLKKGYYKTKKLKEEIEKLCKDNLAVYAIPKEFEYIKVLPKTIVGKVDFRKLQERNKVRRSRK